jgi:solute carrier family 8 (sodium/calcium exchanger)
MPQNAAGEEEDFWNPTVANLTLMALGSSAPEILLNVVGVGFSLDSAADPLGPSTIVGSASFNLLIISAVCVMAPVPDVRKIEGLDVFAVTAFTSVTPPTPQQLLCLICPIKLNLP